ncbi:MAG: dTDP-4-dehydrorhamnose 3,5-epimerase [Methanomicrobiales archaeon]
MIYTETKINGVYIIEPELLNDERGFFARSFCKEEFAKYGFETDIVQCNISYNKKKGTLRGMHYQVPLFEEAKIVSCIEGSIYDVVVDLRRDSSTYCQWVAIDLSDKNFKMMFIPKGCAHGFQTLEDNTMVYYQMMEFFHPECAKGVRWDDPAFKIEWPNVRKRVISDKDLSYNNYRL